MAKITVTRRIDVNQLRSICIKYGLYTQGHNEAYSQMFDKARLASTDAEFTEVALDIWSHSDTEYLSSRDYTLETLCWYVFNDCVRTYINAED